MRLWNRIDDIMCDEITCDVLHLASVAGMEDIICDYLTYDDLNPECEIWDWDDDIICDDLTYGDLNPVYKIMGQD